MWHLTASTLSGILALVGNGTYDVGMAELRVRGIPEPAYRAFRAVCNLEGVTVNERMIELIRREAERLPSLVKEHGKS